jgi:uncharacterized protein (DUF1800 family)
MELHTLGVDGGYTQKDVTEVARCFTGWTMRNLRQGDPEFVFEDRIHDHGGKVVLGHRIEGRGRSEGDEVIHILATHPSTARFVSFKLARRFIADEPPPALVDRAAQRFRETSGDIRAVVREIVTSPEFFDPATRAAKIKTPFEFVVSAVRASGAEWTTPAACRPDRVHGHAALPAAAAHGLQGHRRGLGVDERPAPRMTWPSTSRRAGCGVAEDPARMVSAQTLGSPEFQRK